MLGVTANTSGGVLQLSSGITFPATQVASADPNTLDDYEEGTWTPTYTSTNADVVVNYYNTQSGKYVKIGQFVFVQFSVGASFTSVGTGSIRIAGLPFGANPLDNIPTIKSLVFSQYSGSWGATTPGQVAIVGFASTLCLFDSNMTNATQLATAAFNTSVGSNFNRVHAALWYTV